MGTQLGRGTFSTVHEIIPLGRADAKNAAKMVYTPSLSAWARERVQQEAQVWAVLSHRHVIRFYGQVRMGDWLVMVLELAKGGELFDKVLQMDGLEQVKWTHNLVCLTVLSSPLSSFLTIMSKLHVHAPSCRFSSYILSYPSLNSIITTYEKR